MNACEFNSMLGRYHDGELSAGQYAQFEQHLAGCGECPAELEQLRAISRALRAESMPHATAMFMARLESMASNVEDVTVVRFVRRLTAAAAAILLAATLQWSLHSPPAVQPVAKGPSSDETMIIDPETAANNALPDNNSLASADAQFGPLASELTGGRP
jgi:anti-sigma factor RsiW